MVFSVDPRGVGRAWRNEAPTFEKAFDEKLSFVFANFLKNFLERFVMAKAVAAVGRKIFFVPPPTARMGLRPTPAYGRRHSLKLRPPLQVGDALGLGARSQGVRRERRGPVRSQSGLLIPLVGRSFDTFARTL